jgi:fructan beta-fructosidase
MKYVLLPFAVIVILIACTKETSSISTELMEEPYRPQFHFSPQKGWMNDPNGMVFYNGTYHVFYQHYPDSTVWGPMHWGHASSKDLIHWQHLPIALYPDSLGMIFSGSAVFDQNNSSGLGTNENPPLVAMFTYHDMKGEQTGKNDFQTQGIAFSADGGLTWTKYQNNPVIKNPGIRDFRDPKLLWWEQGAQWIVTLAVKDHVEFYGSKDLKTWSRLSEFGREQGNHGGVWECPDLFPVKDDQGNLQWVLLVSINPGAPKGGSGTQYFVGRFESGSFQPYDTVTRWIDHGADNYAGVTWSGIPDTDGRRIFIGWMSNWNYANVVPTEPWRSALTLPRSVSLIKQSNDWLLKFTPVAEMEKIIENRMQFKAQGDLPAQQVLMEFENKHNEFDLTIENGLNEKFNIRLSNGIFETDRSLSGKTDFHKGFGAKHETDLNGLEVNKVSIYMDHSSIEIFLNDGERVFTELVFPSTPYSKVVFKNNNQDFSIAKIKSIW